MSAGADGSGVYLVYSPGWIDHYGGEPPEPTADVVEVVADSKREAITRAIGRPEMRRWVAMQRGSGKSPFAGLRAEFVTAEVAP